MNMKAYITNASEISLETILGNDTERLLEACAQVTYNWLYPYEGCFRVKGLYVPGMFPHEYKEALEKWYSEHPEDKARYDASRKDWEAERDRQFRIVYGIMKRHHLFILWHGSGHVCVCGDRWTIFRNKTSEEILGYIDCY